MQKKRPKERADGFTVSPNAAEPPHAVSEELWVRPNMNLRHERNGEAGELAQLTPASAQKFLELANIALGLKKTVTPKKKHKSVSLPASVKKRKSTPSSKLTGELQS